MLLFPNIDYKSKSDGNKNMLWEAVLSELSEKASLLVLQSAISSWKNPRFCKCSIISDHPADMVLVLRDSICN